MIHSVVSNCVELHFDYMNHVLLQYAAAKTKPNSPYSYCIQLKQYWV